MCRKAFSSEVLMHFLHFDDNEGKETFLLINRLRDVK